MNARVRHPGWHWLRAAGWAAGCFGVALHGADEGALRASKPGVKKEVLAVVDAQLAAFRAGDVAKAYGFAAVPLRAQNPLRTFAAIVRNNYPEIWANLRAEYGLVRDNGTHATVLVHVFAPAGSAAFDYVLLKERAGWRIGSVVRHEPRKKDLV